MSREERPRGVMLTVLDLTGVVEGAQKMLPDGETAELAHQPYAAAHGPSGELIVVCHEGVGWIVGDGEDQEDLEVPIHVRTPTGFSIFPRYMAHLDRAEVEVLMTGELVDLADLIRTFGARLEANFWLWHRRLVGVTA